jgi:methylated-DNA-protein-cysteine methyltransferase related protein
MPAPLSQKIIATIKKIPRGKVATYGQIAAMSGNPQAARQVVRILNIYSEKEKLPWYRVINSQGKISLKPGSGYELQKALLADEGVLFNSNGKIDFEKYGWK